MQTTRFFSKIILVIILTGCIPTPPTIIPATPTLSFTPTSTPTPTDTPTPTPTPLPIMSFQDFEKNNGTPTTYFYNGYAMPCDFDISIAHEGIRAIHCQAQASEEYGENNNGGTVGINPASNKPLDLSVATSISLWVYDDNDVSDDYYVQLVIRCVSDPERSDELWSANPTIKKEWTKITWELKDITNGVDLSKVTSIELYMFNDGVYYFDDVSYK